jgi:hypothetical protein
MNKRENHADKFLDDYLKQKYDQLKHGSAFKGSKGEML